MMGRLDELIANKCSGKVEYVPVWTVTAWDKKFNSVSKEKQKKIIKYNYFLAADLKELEAEGGTVKILTTSETDLWADYDAVKDVCSEGEIVCIPWGGNPIVQYYKGFFVTGDNRIATSLDTNILNNRFLYYCMENKIDEIASFYRGSGIKHPDMSKVLDLEIPLPPIDVQSEIVRILDNFTELTAELTAELTFRKKQLDYYRENLIVNSEGEIKKLGEVVDIYLGLTATPKYTDSGVKFISAQNTSSDYLDLENVKYISENDYKKATSNAKPKRGDLLFTRVGSNLGHPVIVETDEELCIFVSLGFLRIKKNEEVSVRYLKHWMNTDLFWSQVRKNVHGAAKVNLNTGWLRKFEISIPTLSKQNEIADVLDQMDRICSDFISGLPAEIEARQKQYSYYRNRLLYFENKA